MAAILVGQMPDLESPDWMDKTGMGVVGVLVMDDGTEMTGEITGFDEDSDALLVQVITATRSDSETVQEDRSIPVRRILSFEPLQREAQSWPYSDPCRGGPFLARFVLMTTIFLCMVPGSLLIFILFLNKEPYRLQELSAISYTFFEIFFTFAATRGGPRFKFTCPAVRSEVPRLLRRHLGFLVALFALQTLALAARPGLPGWWNTPDTKGGTPFELTLLFCVSGLGIFKASPTDVYSTVHTRNFCVIRMVNWQQ